jgi:hypothetical protein
MTDEETTVIDVIFDAPAQAEEWPRYDLTLVDLADNPMRSGSSGASSDSPDGWPLQLIHNSAESGRSMPTPSWRTSPRLRRPCTPSTTGGYPRQLREPAQITDGRRPTNGRNRRPSRTH